MKAFLLQFPEFVPSKQSPHHPFIKVLRKKGVVWKTNEPGLCVFFPNKKKPLDERITMQEMINMRIAPDPVILPDTLLAVHFRQILGYASLERISGLA
jgi:hypothetical protein